MVIRKNKGNLNLMKITRLTVYIVIFTMFLTPVFAGQSGMPASPSTDEIMQTATDSIIAPNVFTPNDDGQNDVFEVKSKDGNSVSLKIFTRAGVLVFEIEAKICEWDGRSLSGKRMANGVYYYIAEVTGSSPKVSKIGFVHLFR
jgi:gliding motility-associated-like protein